MLPKQSALRRFALAHFALETQFWFPVWMLFLDHRGFDLATMVVADGVFRFTMVALEFPLGVFSDRIGRKTSYVLIAALGAATYAGIIVIQGPVMLFAVWILWGVFWALSSGTTSAYCYELIALEGLEPSSVKIFGLMRAVASAAALFSQLAAGFLFSLSPFLPFAANGVLALAALGIAVTLPEPTPHPESSSFRGPRSLWRFLTLRRENAAFLAGIVLLAVTLIYFWSPRILMQPLFLELSISPESVSLVYFSYSLAGILAGLAAGRLNALFGGRAAILAGIATLWLGVVLVALVSGRAALFFFPLLSFGYFLSHTLLEVFLHRRLENWNRASILSAVSFAGGAFIIFTRPGLGLLADWKHAPFAFLVWAVVGLAVLVAATYLVKRLPIREAV